MSTVIKGGTIVTADLSFSSDVLVENGKISNTRTFGDGYSYLAFILVLVMECKITSHTATMRTHRKSA